VQGWLRVRVWLGEGGAGTSALIGDLVTTGVARPPHVEDRWPYGVSAPSKRVRSVVTSAKKVPHLEIQFSGLFSTSGS